MPENIVDQNLKNVIRICFEMLEIADRGDAFRQDSGCGAIYGRLRDAAYKIRSLASAELSLHLKSRSATVRQTAADEIINAEGIREQE